MSSTTSLRSVLYLLVQIGLFKVPLRKQKALPCAIWKIVYGPEKQACAEDLGGLLRDQDIEHQADAFITCTVSLLLSVTNAYLALIVCVW
jgi:hypothetical protein